MLSPKEGQLLIARQLLETLEEVGDVAAERVWQAHARVLLQHSQRFMDEVGMVQVLKMQQMCADMVLKIRLAGKKAGDQHEDVLAEYEQMLEELFAMPPEEQPLEAEEGPDGAADDAC